jgi:hypothetical protein
MKKLILSGIVSVFTFNSFAVSPGDDKEHTIEIHVKGGANSTWLFNKNVSNAGNEQDYAAGWGFNYGVGLNMYFGNVGFGVEGLLANHRAAYAGALEIKDAGGVVTGTNNYSSNVNLKVTQIPVMFKWKSEIGGYLEIGPQYNIISSAMYHYSDDAGTTTDTAVTSAFSKSFFSAVLGFGFKIPIAKSRVSVLGGLRLQYSLSDLKGVDGLGRELINPFAYPKGPEKTAGASGGLMLGIVYTLGEKKEKK